MTQDAFERGEWQAVIDAHPLESHDPSEWLRYGVALLQKIQPGREVGRQQQQAALAFVQAQKEGATAKHVAAAQRQSVMLSLREALTLAEIPVPDHPWAGDGGQQEVGVPDGTAVSKPSAMPDQPPREPLRALTAALARVFALELPQQTAVLDQLLAAKEQLRRKEIALAAAEEALCQEFPTGEPAWDAALQKVLLVLR
jgi:hypothetical protein